MIVVLAHLLNANGRDYDASLGSMTIVNTGGTHDRGEYIVTLKKDPRRRGKLAVASVSDFPRRSLSTWELLRRALNDLHERGELL